MFLIDPQLSPSSFFYYVVPWYFLPVKGLIINYAVHILSWLIGLNQETGH